MCKNVRLVKYNGDRNCMVTVIDGYAIAFADFSSLCLCIVTYGKCVLFECIHYECLIRAVGQNHQADSRCNLPRNTHPLLLTVGCLARVETGIAMWSCVKCVSVIL